MCLGSAVTTLSLSKSPKVPVKTLGMLVFAVVTMQGCCQRAGRQLMMNYGEAAAGLRTIDLPLRAKAAGMEFLTNLRRYQQWTKWNR
jgi:hypothetical protein